MNVLFYTTDKLHPTKGGTERTTITIASALKKDFECKVFSIYERQADTPKVDCIEEDFLWIQRSVDSENISFLREIIINNSIDAVIIQGAFVHVARFKKAAKELKCKIIFAHHFQPKAELEFFKFKDVIKSPTNSLLQFLRKLRNIIFYPWMRQQYEDNLATSYKEAYRLADKVVLLSKGFIKPYMEYCGLKDSSKFEIIPNALSFDSFATEEDLKGKKKRVLIVSRLDDTHKKISTALKIWRQVKQFPTSDGWELDIIGDGPDKKRYKEIVSKYHIPGVNFYGRQNPIPFYKSASLYMMTSSSESWGLTLTESQQMGVVPVAFNTYESLKDIIADGENGFIIKPGDEEGYCNAILSLMLHNEKWQYMEKNGLKSCRRFTSSSIAKIWWNLIVVEM